jgi:D-beta-D-heptose 7-phosphate kinase/D-beta-D-heptose 1-phosphate adenosyltransferase
VTGIGTCSAVLLSDYGKGCLSADLIAVILEIGLQKQIPVVIDPKGRDYTKYASATIITPNYKEACESLGVAESEKIPGSELGQVLLEKFGFQYVLVTLGADGMVLVRKGKKPLHLPAVAHEVFDVSGAGDTVAAVITLCLSCKLPIEEAVRLANLAAGIAVTKQGTQTVSRKELMREVKKERSLFNQVKTFFSGI